MKDYLKYWKIESPVFIRQIGGKHSEDIYISESLRLILSRLEVIFSQPGSVGYLYGAPGCGKTTLANHLQRSLGTREFEMLTIYVGGRFSSGSDWLAPQLSDFFGVSKGDPLSSLLAQISDIEEDKRKLIIAIDGIENFKSTADFEPLLRFLNWESLTRPCVSFLLIGRPESLSTLKQSAIYHNMFVEIEWPEMTSTDIEQFVQKSLKSKKMSASLYSLNAVQELARQCQASMRRLATILEQSLVIAADLGLKKIDAEIIRQATLSSSGNTALLNIRDSVS